MYGKHHYESVKPIDRVTLADDELERRTFVLGVGIRHIRSNVFVPDIANITAHRAYFDDAISARQGFMHRYQGYLGNRAFTSWQYLPPVTESSRGAITLPYLFES